MPEEQQQVAHRLSAEEIETLIHDMAKFGDGPDQRWALSKLREEAEAQAVVVAPLTDNDVVQRLARLMRGAGVANSRAAYVIAHGNYKPQGPLRDRFKESVDVPPGIDLKKLPATLKAFYRRYPQFKGGGGFPQGYPVGEGPVKQMKWLQQRSLEVEKEMFAAKAADVVRDIDNIRDLPTDGNDASTDGGSEATSLGS